MRTIIRSATGTLVALMAVAAACLPLSVAPASAQANNCHRIDVDGIRAPRVDLYTLQGQFARSVARDELGQIDHATSCSDDSPYLMIEVGRDRWLVRRIALNTQAIVVPYCACGTHQGQDLRNASGSGLGVSCRRPTAEMCPGG